MLNLSIGEVLEEFIESSAGTGVVESVFGHSFINEKLYIISD